jgi:hypothetical protein
MCLRAFKVLASNSYIYLTPNQTYVSPTGIDWTLHTPRSTSRIPQWGSDTVW